MAYAPRILTLPADRPRFSRFVLFLMGALTTLAFEPFGLSLLAPLLLVPLLFVCVTLAPRDAAGHAFWYGFGLFLSGTYWIYISVVVFGEAPPWIAVLLMLGLILIMSLWLYVAGWLVSRLAQGENLRLLAIAPAAWVLVEWLRGWILTGFPWLALGYSQIDSVLAGFAPVAGVYGVSFAVVLTAAAVLATFSNRGATRRVALVFVILPWLSGGILTFFDWTEADGKALRASVLQFGISQDKKWLRENRERTLEYYRDKTRAARQSELVVWPEVAVPSLMSRERAYIEALQADLTASGQTVAFGILEDVTNGEATRIYNSVVVADGRRLAVYRKRHLVPFGEYFPVPARVREWLRMMSLPHNDLSAGKDVQELPVTAGGTRLAVMICYEDAYGAELLYALPDAGILVNVSNDAWFGNSIAPHQHLQIARMRSLEVGRPTIRATNTGISAFIDHEGRIVRRGAQFRAVELSAGVQARRGSTPYSRAGNRPVIGLCLLILAFFWLRAGR